jgi:hypothetical protein
MGPLVLVIIVLGALVLFAIFFVIGATVSKMLSRKSTCSSNAATT